MKNIFYLVFLVFLGCNSRHFDDQSQKEANTTGNTEIANTGDCVTEDGRHTATVDYNNPKTGFANSYTLDVEVEDCHVTTIYFENGGYLDDSHIAPADIDEDGNASVEDDKGRSYAVHIED